MSTSNWIGSNSKKTLKATWILLESAVKVGSNHQRFQTDPVQHNIYTSSYISIMLVRLKTLLKLKTDNLLMVFKVLNGNYCLFVLIVDLYVLTIEYIKLSIEISFS